MAQITRLTATQRRKLEEKIDAGLKERKLKGKASLGTSGLVGRYRLFVISPDFASMPQAERDSLVWRILEEQWQRVDQLRITLCLALTPSEAVGGD